jgi:hypothetical protein
MGLRSLFQRQTAAAAVIAPSGPEPRKPPTPEQLAELKEAWAKFSEAAKSSGVKSVHACTRSGNPWQEDPAAV